jgi:hypothetical protein
VNKPPLKYFVEFNGSMYPSLHLFEYGKQREGYWGGDEMRDHTDELIDALEHVYGEQFTYVFLFDWSSGHAKYPPGALNVHVMQVNFNGKKENESNINPPTILDEDYVNPDNFPNNLPKLKKGDIQHMRFQENVPPPFYKPNLTPEAYVGKAKGMKQVLFERGLFVHGMTENGPKDGSNISKLKSPNCSFILGREVIFVIFSQSIIQSSLL